VRLAGSGWFRWSYWAFSLRSGCGKRAGARTHPIKVFSRLIAAHKAEAAFDPEIIAVPSAIDEAWERLLQSGSECTRPAYASAMRESLRSVSSIWRNGALEGSKELANGAVLLRTIDLSTNAGKVRRKRLSRRRRFPRLRVPMSEKACRPLTFWLGLLEVSHR
jgi:hypothetical protein